MNKIDFALVIGVNHGNPNGDPLNGNRPRQDNAGNGIISDVCLKRKLRDRLQDLGETIFCIGDEGTTSLQAKYAKVLGSTLSDAERRKAACDTWFDVRAFGSLFAYPKTKEAKPVSFGVRGPVTIQNAYSVAPIDVVEMQITKSVNGVTKEGSELGSDRMGMKYSVDNAVYVAYGSICPQLAKLTGFTSQDVEKLKKAIIHLFEGDASSARPGGSTEMLKLIWWEHNSALGQYSSAKVHRSLNVDVADGGTVSVTTNDLDGLTPQFIEGF